jgi:putative Mg2+ transporter-C (MgtC) family protein
MFETLLSGYEIPFLVDLFLGILFGYAIGAEREMRGKDAGISTHTLVIVGAMLFTFMSAAILPSDKTRIAANLVTGIGFLGAGLIMKGDSGKVRNLTTAASIWFSGAIGMALGFGFHLIALIATIACVFIPRMPHADKHSQEKMDDQKKQA